MRRTAGFAAFDRQKEGRQKFSDLGSSIVHGHIEQLNTQLETFRAALTVFAREHAKDIRSNALFRRRFSQLCAIIGVDPLVSSKSSSKKAWNEVLGVCDFYYELAIKLIEYAQQVRDEQGGLLSLNSTVQALSHKSISTGGTEIRDQDIEMAVSILAPMKSGYCIVTIGDQKWIQTTAKEFSQDETRVLDAAQALGFVTERILKENFGWNTGRVGAAIEDLLRDSLLWLDSQGAGGENMYWTPTVLSAKYPNPSSSDKD